MPFVSFDLNEKIEMAQFATLEEAHKYCMRGVYPVHVLFANTTFEDVDENKFGKPVAIYIRGKRYNVEQHEE
jgi:hypothetical protein